MLDLRFVVDHLPEVRTALARRNAAAAASLGAIEELARRRKEAIASSERLAAERNRANEEMARLPKGSPEFLARRDELKRLSAEQKEREKEAAAVEAEIQGILQGVPNLPLAAPAVPDGEDASSNVEVKVWGERPAFSFAPKPHWELGVQLRILDFDRAAKLSGSRFSVLFGAGARLERALIQFMLDLHTEEHGYTEVQTPFLVRGTALYGTGNLPKFEQDLFKIQGDAPDMLQAMYLIPTAEVPVTNLHGGELLEADRLPLAYVAYTPCFRSEAGSAGRDVRGMIRQHQFDKVELVRLVTVETAEEQHELLTRHGEIVLERLGLHYRRVLLCAGDMGFSSQKTYDLEVWLPSEGNFREISSCSWFGDFQARRADLRYRPEPKAKPRFLHTINGSALAVGRTLIAVLEQYQQEDGSVKLPEVLRPYLGGKRRIGVSGALE
ncbi:MAG: serine--tRNA ligase [Myxococcales bacterium]|nr:serine--tRNA ligase [Polyangiaceae bacterium]MDW8248391.1 serine--tRNA ligase [Myxococcales bacterium]